MKFFGLAASFCGVISLSACTSAAEWPNGEIEKRQFVRLNELIYSMECELGEAVEAAPSKYRDFADQKALATLSLTVTEAPSVNGGISLGIPVGVANVTLGGTGKTDFNNTRTMEVSVAVNPKSLGVCSTAEAGRRGVKRIESGLGLKEWIAEMIKLLDKSQYVPASASYSTTFKITNSPGGTLSFTNTGTGRGGGTASLGVGDKYEFSHKISITIAKFKTPPSAAPKASRTVEPELQSAADSFLLRQAIQQMPE